MSATASGPVPGRLASVGFGSTQFHVLYCNLLPRLHAPLLINVLTFICLMTYVKLFEIKIIICTDLTLGDKLN